ncbi:MAG: EVE domain-containing protein [Bauldia sp.]|nr:EVE domain-containing protein [Bauldia sp.]MCW5716384.1 EVE domain-containing protein [Bauldia sp.]
MAHWLVKTEPESWSWDDQMKQGAKGGEWTGVRNPQANRHMREMRKGDRVFFYHTGKEKQVVGIAEVVGEAHPDSTDAAYPAVDLRAVEALKRPVTLAEVKADALLKDGTLARAPRLSVQPVTDAEWQRIMELSKT